MSRRALIVSVERYDPASGVEPVLPGTDRGALLFREWLIHTRGFAPSSIKVCAGDGVEWRSAGTTRAEILAVAAELAASPGETDELHVFLSGHGVVGTDDVADGPVRALAPSDFRASDPAATAITLRELEAALAPLRPARQHWLVDCRREAITTVPELDTPREPAAGHRYLLASASHQAPWSRVVGSFARVRVSGLATPDGTAYVGHVFVTFDLLTGVARHGSGDRSDALRFEISPLATQGCGGLELDARSASSGARYATSGWRHGFEERPYAFVAVSCDCLVRADVAKVASPTRAGAA